MVDFSVRQQGGRGHFGPEHVLVVVFGYGTRYLIYIFKKTLSHRVSVDTLVTFVMQLLQTSR